MSRLDVSRAATLTVLVGLAGYGCEGHDPAGRVQVSDRDCVLCHLEDYELTQRPPHAQLFPQTCGDCHTTTHWIPAQGAADHEWWPLENRHAETPCSACHTVGYATGDTPTDCVGCHRADYDASAFPGHDRFATTCQDCHSTAGWSPAVGVDHDWWPLENRHAEAACATCHTVGYDPGDTPTECVGCHRSDYDTSPYLGHDAFPTTCEGCHTTAGWTPATGGHPEAAFRIASGDHRDIECLECHDPSLGSYRGGVNTDCVGCHEGEHTRSRMDDKHREVRDYPGDDSLPSFCLRCHEDGRN